jgi:hypothetical protein
LLLADTPTIRTPRKGRTEVPGHITRSPGPRPKATVRSALLRLPHTTPTLPPGTCAKTPPPDRIRMSRVCHLLTCATLFNAALICRLASAAADNVSRRIGPSQGSISGFPRPSLPALKGGFFGSICARFRGKCLPSFPRAHEL